MTRRTPKAGALVLTLIIGCESPPPPDHPDHPSPSNPDVIDGRDWRESNCEVHTTKLKAGIAPILYGLLMGGNESEYPYAHTHYRGGCVWGRYAPASFAVVKYCPLCRCGKITSVFAVPKYIDSLAEDGDGYYRGLGLTEATLADLRECYVANDTSKDCSPSYRPADFRLLAKLWLGWNLETEWPEIPAEMR